MAFLGNLICHAVCVLQAVKKEGDLMRRKDLRPSNAGQARWSTVMRDAVMALE